MKASRRRRRGRGGRGGHEPLPLIRQREQDVMELAATGLSQHQIARRLGISQAAVCKILERLDAQWVRENQQRLDRYKADLVRKLDRVYREGMDAWEKSKAQRTRRRQRKTQRSEGDSGTVAEVVIDDSCGDPRHLEAARRALADRARVLGFDGRGPRGDDDSDDVPAVIELHIDPPMKPASVAQAKEISDEKA